MVMESDSRRIAVGQVPASSFYRSSVFIRFCSLSSNLERHHFSSDGRFHSGAKHESEARSVLACQMALFLTGKGHYEQSITIRSC